MAENEDNVAPLKPGQKPDLVGKAQAVITKARTDQFQNKVNEKVKLLAEQKKAVKITEAEINQLVEEFEQGF